MSIALGTILSEIKIIDFPWGGSATLLSMLIICLPGYLFGLGAGLVTGVAYGILQLLVDPYVLFPMQLVLDYLLAFGSLGLSGIFASSKNGLVKGYLTGILGRYVFTVLSGWIFFGEYAWEGGHTGRSRHSCREKRHRRRQKDGSVININIFSVFLYKLTPTSQTGGGSYFPYIPVPIIQSARKSFPLRRAAGSLHSQNLPTPS